MARIHSKKGSTESASVSSRRYMHGTAVGFIGSLAWSPHRTKAIFHENCQHMLSSGQAKLQHALAVTQAYAAQSDPVIWTTCILPVDLRRHKVARHRDASGKLQLSDVELLRKRIEACESGEV